MKKLQYIVCEVSYQGSAYYGFACQKGYSSVEEMLKRSFSKITGQPVKLKVAGRTDRGVHAVAQVVSFQARLPVMSAGQFTLAANSLLPDDIKILLTTFCKQPFDARRAARSRVYVYNVINGPDNVFCRPYSINVQRPLNLKSMRRAASFLIGQQNYAVLGAAGSDFKTTVRRVLRIDIRVNKIKELRRLFGEKITGVRLFQFIIEANAFLYKMCRNIVGFLLEVGLGRIPARAAEKLLQTPKGVFRFKPAPARGLFLVKINY